jgi:hypothetical protein
MLHERALQAIMSLQTLSHRLVMAAEAAIHDNGQQTRWTN